MSCSKLHSDKLKGGHVLRTSSVYLRDIADIIAGYTDLTIEEAEYCYSALQANSFSDTDALTPLQVMYRPKEAAAKALVRSGDVLVKRLNPNFAFVAGNVSKLTVATQSLFIVRPNEQVLPEYLAYLFEQKEVLSQIEHISGSGLAIRAVTKDKLMNAEIPIIPLEQQHAIGQLWILTKRRRRLLAEYTAEYERLALVLSKKTIIDGGFTYGNAD